MNAFASITEELERIPSRQAISAVHLAIRLITHRTHLASTQFNRQILSADFTERDSEIAKELVELIERFEKADITEFDKPTAEAYVKTLAAVVDDLIRSERDPIRGQALLEKLRSA